ncbi:hypothetical protein L1987_38345 [Smallanthus sonchifolius]|uniref:Uncharacterized protein n=1 Tax=Smallanthus sonchifolius TaxID=185202 RepID=A0ACB9HJU5_9ASTR|nr:hypothetical protein L1987_38345 [Smallanthus sonchifolius]
MWNLASLSFKIFVLTLKQKKQSVDDCKGISSSAGDSKPWVSELKVAFSRDDEQSGGKPLDISINEHPAAKRIVIEMRPNYHPEGLYDDNKVSTESKEIDNIIKQLWHVNGMCPEDNPIQKNKRRRRCFESKFC